MADCWECEGAEPRYGNKCDEHNVCVQCGIHRSKLDHTPWGHRKGFMCKPCADHNDKLRLEEAMEKFKEKEYDDWDFQGNDEVLCPYCGTKSMPESEDYGCTGNQFDFECHCCKNIIAVVPEFSVHFSSYKKEKP